MAHAHIPALGRAEAPGTMPQDALGPGLGSSQGSVPESTGTSTRPTRAIPATPGGLVNLNTADEAALEELPGVGPVTAEAIVAHRSEVGPFTQVEDLLEVRGIGDAKLEGMADLVTV
ncbi:MAG: helix-hairpin-helix domain-containing protein [Candidatus Microthrix sp.]|uniref:ComEA family DNA-binding protein n=1 Tax=Candidatus Neomicrothrix sp. TaxID=2719034 RepID=UPI0025B9877F|nr:helix-hairpin-helix domain-containing protein [Candidatus Microthrix sp.]MBL0203100.1 helix-hairpin-helix domain-containing protein [Candidatus Microthrix sp.]